MIPGSLGDPLPGTRQPIPGHLQRFGGRSVCTGLMRRGRSGSHRNQMDVDVSVDAGACAATEVDADVIVGDTQFFLDDSFCFLKQACCFNQLVGGQICQTGQMTVGNDHQMADRIGVEVQHNEGMRTTVDHERLLDILIQDLITEDAPATLFDPEDVGHAPRCPKGLHALPASFSIACVTGVEANMLRQATGGSISSVGIDRGVCE